MKKPENPKKVIVYRNPSELRPHPLQAELFSNVSTNDIARLAESLENDGQLDDVEIVPDASGSPHDLVIGGWQRVRAARNLKWKRVRCWLRSDLAELGDQAIERRLLEANFLRRQLTPIEQARVYRRLRQLQRRGPLADAHVAGDLRDYLGNQFHVTGRTLDRWERLLDTPVEVQKAFIDKRLPLVVAGKVAGMTKRIQREIADRLRDGEDPLEVVSEFLPKDVSTRSNDPQCILKDFVKTLKRAVEGLPGNIEQINLGDWGNDLATLRKGRTLMDKLIPKMEKDARRFDKGFANVQAEFRSRRGK